MELRRFKGTHRVGTPTEGTQRSPGGTHRGDKRTPGDDIEGGHREAPGGHRDMWTGHGDTLMGREGPWRNRRTHERGHHEGTQTPCRQMCGDKGTQRGQRRGHRKTEGTQGHVEVTRWHAPSRSPVDELGGELGRTRGHGEGTWGGTQTEGRWRSPGGTQGHTKRTRGGDKVPPQGDSAPPAHLRTNLEVNLRRQEHGEGT